MIDLVKHREPVTTSGVIALTNLHAQIDSLANGPGSDEQLLVTQQADLIDLLLLRGQILGRIADYECAAQLAEQFVDEAPTEGSAYLGRARTHATFHRFAEALADLDSAERYGLETHTEQTHCENERAAIYQALGRYEDAATLRNNAVARRPDFMTLSALAGLQAERGEIAEAERLFSAGRQCYQGVSPFPLALIDFQRRRMWLGQGDLDNARRWFAGAVARLPSYAPAQGHLAEVEAALGEVEAAIARLRPLATDAGDPEYAALLAKLLHQVGETEEADQWHSRAVVRYAELVARYPAAFAHHAVAFGITASVDVLNKLPVISGRGGGS